ncbi:hypothetical protein C8J56DRAFT_898808 [Mycena floridula]|nr:hypothetical protein C8J56DRAFT_898808 [Mycena floridula]
MIGFAPDAGLDNQFPLLLKCLCNGINDGVRPREQLQNMENIRQLSTGDFPPFQCSWGGKIDKSLPSKKADRMPEALERGFQFTVAASDTSHHSHFRTFKTMKEWVTGIIQPYMRGVIKADPELPDDQMAWQKCTFKSANGTEWNLSADCLTGRKAQMALNEYLRKDQELHDEIIDHLGAVQGIEPGEAENKMDLD